MPITTKVTIACDKPGCLHEIVVYESNSILPFNGEFLAKKAEWKILWGLRAYCPEHVNSNRMVEGTGADEPIGIIRQVEP